jgi:hypothetical protein
MLKAVLQNFKFKFKSNPGYNLMILNNIKYQLDTYVFKIDTGTPSPGADTSIYHRGAYCRRWVCDR